MTTYNGFISNILKDDGSTVCTAANGRFEQGFATMQLEQLDGSVEGYDEVGTATLRELAKHTDALREGKTVNIFLEWQLSADRLSYTAATATHVEYE